MIRNPRDRVDRKMQPRFRGLDPVIDWHETNEKMILGGGTGNAPYQWNNAMHKAIYTTETTSLLASVTLSVGGTVGTRGITNKVNGYFMGRGVSGGNNAAIDKYTMSTDTNAANSNSMPEAVSAGGTGGNGAIGYFSGGYTTTDIATGRKFTFSSATITNTTSANLTEARRAVAGCCASQTATYIAGGYTTSGRTKTDKIVFATDTCSNIASANLPAARWNGGGITNYSTIFVCLGSTNSGVSNAILKIAVSTDIISTSSSTMATAKEASGAASSSSTKGFFITGWTTGYSNQGETLVMSTEASSNVTGLNSTTTLVAAGGMG